MKFLENQQQVNEILDFIEKQLHHSFLEKYIENPAVDLDRIHLLLLPFLENDGGFQPHQVIKSVSTAMLIQIALDTHDKVTNSKSESLKERQLTVLAGDYFSGLYYKILSETNHVQLIKALAKGTKEVNESKVSLYKKENTNIDEIIESFCTIESAIIRNYLKYFNQTKWTELAEHILMIKRLLIEQGLLEKGILTSFTSAISDTPEQKAFINRDHTIVIQLLENLLSEYRNRLASMQKKLTIPSEYISDRISLLLDHPQSINKIFVEEG